MISRGMAADFAPRGETSPTNSPPFVHRRLDAREKEREREREREMHVLDGIHPRSSGFARASAVDLTAADKLRLAGVWKLHTRLQRATRSPVCSNRPGRARDVRAYLKERRERKESRRIRKRGGGEREREIHYSVGMSRPGILSG